jgi:hypothetical protein
MKTIFIKFTKAGPTSGPFDIYDQTNKIIESNVSKKELVAGVAFIVNDDVIAIKIVATGDCKYEKIVLVTGITFEEYAATQYTETVTGCLWRHLTNIQLYNSFYGKICPYIIEYPFSYKYQDEILQNVKDYTKAYNYLPDPDGVFNNNIKIETDTQYFNKAVLYNGQQSSGMLELVAKPLHNLKEYMSYPKFNSNSKTILFTKSDNFYLYNTFWALNKSSQVPLFNVSCESLSIDKIINDSNMDYSTRSFRKSPLRAKDLKVRHILDDSCTTHLVSQFILASTQISYK